MDERAIAYAWSKRSMIWLQQNNTEQAGNLLPYPKSSFPVFPNQQVGAKKKNRLFPTIRKEVISFGKLKLESLLVVLTTSMA